VPLCFVLGLVLSMSVFCMDIYSVLLGCEAEVLSSAVVVLPLVSSQRSLAWRFMLPKRHLLLDSSHWTFHANTGATFSAETLSAQQAVAHLL